MRHLLIGFFGTVAVIALSFWLSWQIHNLRFSIVFLPIVFVISPLCAQKTQHLVGSVLAVALPTIFVLFHDRYMVDETSGDGPGGALGAAVIALCISAYLIGVTVRFFLYAAIVRLRASR